MGGFISGGLNLNGGASGCPYRSELDELTLQQSLRSCYGRDHARGMGWHTEHEAVTLLAGHTFSGFVGVAACSFKKALMDGLDPH